MNFKYKCEQYLEIYASDNKSDWMLPIEINSNTYIYELPALIGCNSKEKINGFYEQIKDNYNDIVLYRGGKFISQDYEKFVSEYFNIKEYTEGIVSRIILTYIFEKIE